MPINSLAIPGIFTEEENDKPHTHGITRNTLLFALAAAMSKEGIEYNTLFGQQRINGRTIWREP